MRSPLTTMLGAAGAVCLLLVAPALTAGCQQGGGPREDIPAAPDEQDPVTPEELLTRMAAFMAAHDDYSFEALVTYQSLQESGQTLHFDMIERVAVSQPDRLAWVTLQDDGSSDHAWYSDGRFSMLKQPENIYGQIDAPASIPEMIDLVASDYGIVVPFSDLLASGDGSVFLRDLQASEYVELARVEGEWTHHLALRNELVDFEVWMQAEGDPFPLKLAIIWKLEEGLPAYVARFRNWNFSPEFDDSKFRFDAPEGAERIDVLPLDVAEGVEP